ncbi:MAG TPA: hypothetical protein VKY31_06105, partial [Terriglobia bacterium]|nr:hypothetical protein [Terriglobia bacterium]
MPWPVRLALRRLRAGYKRRVWRSVWPIDEKAGTPPPEWQGWPGRKQFAVVLTHDVEGVKGMNRVERLARCEMELGFRSSFNFVPEGEYRLSPGLRETLERAGFEIGVHGLEHDGKLYRSKAAFAAKAVSIREYLRRWNACGFRSPLMQHRLGWLHQLGLEYDCSTFDTDPFEPESDGVRTIFPFWVANPNGAGYVELPYTLVQDFTLFIVLREKNIDIWKTKLEWIANCGGMALLNTHPDYMTFGDTPTRDEFPVSHYTSFLKYIQDTYGGIYWNALPREVARYYCAQLPRSSRNSRKRICMMAYTHYETDNRVRRYAESLVKRGDHVDVIALGTGNARLRSETIGGVTLFRLQRRENDERHKWTYAWRLFRFL